MKGKLQSTALTPASLQCLYGCGMTEILTRRSARCLGITSSHRPNLQQLITGTPSQAKVAKVPDKVLQGHRPRCKQSYKVEPAFASR